MKYYRSLIYTLISCCLFLNSPTVCADDSQAADRETARLTAKILIGQLKKKLITTPIEKGIILTELSSNKKQYHRTAESKALIKMFVQQTLEKKFHHDVEEILKSLNANLREGNTSWFTAQDRSSFMLFPKTAVLDSLDNNFSKIYSSERRKACNAQWKNLTMNVYPTENEFISMESRELYDLLLRRILTKQQESLFEESERYLKTEFINPIIDDAQAQLNQQIKILSESTGGTAKLPAEIEAAVHNELEKNRRSLRKKKANKKIGNKVYAVFKMVEDKVAYRAKDIAAAKFSQYLKDSSFPINAASIKRAIDGDIYSHLTTDQSFSICTQKYEDEITGKAVANYLLDIADSNGKFRVFLTRLLVDGQQVHEEAQALIKRSLTKGFSQARQLVANGQMNDFFMPLQSGKWSLPNALIEREFYNSGPITRLNTLDLKGISAGTFNKDLLIEETKEAINQAIEKIGVEGRRAMKGQYSIVDSLEQQIFVGIDKLKIRDANSIARTMLTFFKKESSLVAFEDVSDTQKIVAFYKKRIYNTWQQKRKQLVWPENKGLPENHTEKYKVLFAAIEADIVRRVKAIMHNEDDYLTERRKHDPSKFTKLNLASGGGSSRAKPGQKAGSGAGIGTGVGEIDSDVLIDIKYSGENIEISLDFVNRKYPVKVILAQNNYGAELDPIVAAFDEWIVLNAKKGEEVRMDVVMRIFNNDIHYGLVAEIRRRLKFQIAKKHSQTINIQWTDMLFTADSNNE